VEARKVKVISRQVGAYEYICLPSCELSYLACQLVKQDYLDGVQVKLLELMGFEFEITNKDTNNNYGD